MRHDDKYDYYLVSIDGDHSNIKYYRYGSWSGLCVPTVELEPVVMLPVPELTDEEILDKFREAGGSFHGPITESAIIPESELINFVRSLL